MYTSRVLWENAHPVLLYRDKHVGKAGNLIYLLKRGGGMIWSDNFVKFTLTPFTKATYAPFLLVPLWLKLLRVVVYTRENSEKHI
jgi:hypothetical protein